MVILSGPYVYEDVSLSHVSAFEHIIHICLLVELIILSNFQFSTSS